MEDEKTHLVPDSMLIVALLLQPARPKRPRVIKVKRVFMVASSAG